MDNQTMHSGHHGYHEPVSPGALQAAHHMHAYKAEHQLGLPMEYGAMGLGKLIF